VNGALRARAVHQEGEHHSFPANYSHFHGNMCLKGAMSTAVSRENGQSGAPQMLLNGAGRTSRTKPTGQGIVPELARVLDARSKCSGVWWILDT
jgi:hypothetical protein